MCLPRLSLGKAWLHWVGGVPVNGHRIPGAGFLYPEVFRSLRGGWNLGQLMPPQKRKYPGADSATHGEDAAIQWAGEPRSRTTFTVGTLSRVRNSVWKARLSSEGTGPAQPQSKGV